MVGGASSGLVLRPGRPEDHAAFARLFLELKVPDPPPPPAAWEAELMPLTFFHDGPQGPLAYTIVDVLGELGYVVQLVVAPEARRHGLGKRMMEGVAEHFREKGCRRWALNVKKDNTAALSLYTSLGMRPARELTTLKVTRVLVEALPLSPEGLEVVPVLESEWAPLTEAFRLMPGKLARFAKWPSHKLLRLSRDGEPEPMRLGMMDLRSGGVLFPFFAATPGHARVLLDHAFRQVGAETVNVTVIDDAPLAALLRDAGGRVEMEMQELQGPLPG